MMKLVVMAAIALLIVWVYAPSMRGGFVYEDYKWTDGCASVPVFLAASSRWPRTGTRWSWCAQVGQPAWAFRVVSLGLHLVVVGLVGALAWTVTREWVPSMFSAAFFGLNAVGVESVAYLSSRGELLAAIGVIGACLSATRGLWVLACLLIVLGLSGKETASVAVMLVPLCVWYQRRSARWAWVTVAGAALLVSAIVYRTIDGWFPSAMSMGDWALLQTTAIARVTALSVFPFGQTVDYDYAGTSAVVAIVAIVAALAWVSRQSRLVVCGAAWVACAVAPRLLVPTPQSVFNEHQFYLPMVGMSLILAGLLMQEGETV